MVSRQTGHSKGSGTTVRKMGRVQRSRLLVLGLAGIRVARGRGKRRHYMFEHRSQPLASQRDFARRLSRYALATAGIILFSLGIGMLGYHYFESLSWIDFLLNASMILGGMGPVNPLQTTGGKLFASFYALYSGIILLASVGVLATPIFHRLLHSFHLELEDN